MGDDYLQVLQELAKFFGDPERFGANPSRALSRLAAERRVLTSEDLRRLTEQAALYLEVRPERVEAMLDLNGQEMRRALKVKPYEVYRYPDEQLYPRTGWLGAYLLYTQESENPMGWHFWAAVTLLASVFRNTLYWDRGNYFLPINHYTLILGETGLTKSTVLGAATDILERLNEFIKERGEFDHSIRDREIYVSANQITPEKLMEDLGSRYYNQAEGSRVKIKKAPAHGLIASDELVEMLGRNKKGSDRMVAFLTSVYGGKREYKSLTVSHKDRILEDVMVNCLFATTEDWMRTDITDSLFGGGTMGRFMVVQRKEANRRYFKARPFDPVVASSLARMLVPWALNENKIELTWTPEAHQVFEDQYLAAERASHGDEKMKGYHRRKVDHIHKLAAILFLSDYVRPDGKGLMEALDRGHLELGMEYLKNAQEIVEDEERRLPDAFAEVGGDQDSRDRTRALELVRTWHGRLRKPITHAKLLRHLKPRMHSRRLRYILEGLEDEGLVRRHMMVGERGPAKLAWEPLDEQP